jgi:hypothetical protein
MPCVPVYLALLLPQLEPSFAAATASSSSSAVAAIPMLSSSSSAAPHKVKSASQSSSANASANANANANGKRERRHSMAAAPAHWVAAARANRIAEDDDEAIEATSASVASRTPFPARTRIVFRPANGGQGAVLGAATTAAAATSSSSSSSVASSAVASSSSLPAPSSASTSTSASAAIAATLERRTELLHCHAALLGAYGAHVRAQIEADGFVDHSQSDLMNESEKGHESLTAAFFAEQAMPFVEAARRSMLSQLFL